MCNWIKVDWVCGEKVYVGVVFAFKLQRLHFLYINALIE